MQPSMPQGNITPEMWEQYLGAMDEFIQGSAGWEREKLKAQRDDAAKGYQNAREIAKIQAQTSRYGIDAQSATALRALKENARQFDATHALQLKRFGLERAQVATDYLSTPDRFVQASDFLNLSGRVMADQGGQPLYGAGETPQQKTMGDFEQLETGGNPGRQVTAQSAGAAGGGGATAQDARIKALKAVMDASPPSPGEGLDANGYHVLNAAREIYSMNLTPTQQAAIGSSPQYQKMLGSAGRRLGRDPEEWAYRQRRTLPGQGSARSA